MFGIAGETQFDLRFNLFGIPIRVHPLFWLIGAYLGWDPQRIDLVLVWILCLFVSILIHELGHAVASRHYGFPSQIVLYAMGGYATTGRFSTWKSVIVSAAGPAAGFVLGFIALFFWIGFPELVRQHELLIDIIWNLMWINLFWTCVNLVPCLPLDGGRIMQSLIHRYAPHQANKRVMQISIFFSGVVAFGSLYLFRELNMMTILFGVICLQTVMAYNSQRG